MNNFKAVMLKLYFVLSVLMFTGTCFAITRNDTEPYAVSGGQMNRFTALKAGNLHVRSLKIHPSFHERVEYDDNIFKVSDKFRNMDGQTPVSPPGLHQQNEHKEEDVVNVMTPGLSLELPLGERFFYGKIHKLGLKWNSDFKNFADNPSQNQQNHYVLGSVTLEVLKGFDLTLNQDWQHTEAGAGSETDQIHARDTNTTGIGLRMSQIFRSLNKLDIEVKYQNFDQDYTQKLLERANRNESRYSINLYYNLTPKLTIKLPQYTYTVINYDKHRPESASGSNTDPLSDSHSNELSGGIIWKATAKTTGFFNIGFVDRSYEQDTHEFLETSDVSSYIMEGGLTTRLPWDTFLKFSLFRTLQEAEFTAKSNSFFSTGGNFTVSRNFTKKLYADMTAGFFQTDFNGVDRSDNVYDFALNANYLITKWSRIEAGYSYRDKDSSINYDQESERINKAYVGVGFGF